MFIDSQIHISRRTNASGSEGDEFDESDEEKHTKESFGKDIDSEEDGSHPEERQLGVTPFMSGVLPAGRLRAKTQPLGGQASGLIQVRLTEMRLKL